MFLISCGNVEEIEVEDDSASKPAIKALRVERIGAHASLGDTVQFKAIGTLPNDQTQDVTSFSEWSIGNTTDSELVGKGRLKIKNNAIAGRAVSINAQFINLADTEQKISYYIGSRVIIRDRRILGVTVSPASISLVKGQSQEFRCSSLFSNQTNQNDSCSWTLSLNGGSLDSSTSSVSKKTGEKVSLYTSQVAVASGSSVSGTLTVSVADNFGNVKDAVVNIVVSGAKIRELKMKFVDVDATPNNASVAKGRKSQIFVEAVRTDDTTMDVSDLVSFSLTSGGILSLNNTSREITGLSVGNSTIIARYNIKANTDNGREKQVSGVFTVTAAEPVSLGIRAETGTSITKNQRQILTAFYELTDSTNQNAAAGDVSWSVTSTNTNSVLNTTSGNPVYFSSDTTGGYRVKAEANNLDATIDIKVEKTPDTTKPGISFDIPKERIVAGTVAFDISVDIDASDDRKIDAYYLSTDPAVPGKNASGWITPASFPVKTSYNITQRPVNDYEELTIYAWSRDGAQNISDVSSDKIMVIHAIDYNNSDGKNPLIAQEWYLKNTGQNAYSASGGTAGEDLNVEYVHNTLGYKGKGVKVVVVDNSLELAHEDLKDNILPGRSNLNYRYSYYEDGSDNRFDPSPSLSEFEDKEGSHGSNVSGIINMRDNNDVGGSGIAPKASLMGINYTRYQLGWAYEANALGMYPSPDFAGNANNINCRVPFFGAKMCKQVIDSYHRDMTGTKPEEADVFNMSYGSILLSPQPFNSPMEMIFRYGTQSLRNGRGAVYIKAAGNSFKSFKNNIIFRDCNFFAGNNFFPNIVVTFIGTNGSGDEIHRGVFYSLNSDYKPCYNVNNDPSDTSPYIIIITSANSLGNNSFFSDSGSNVWIAGVSGGTGYNSPAMITTDRTGCGIGNDVTRRTNFNRNRSGQNPSCKYINTFSGTSAAAPSISGVVALMLEANPDLTWLDVKHILAKTAKKPDLAGIARTDITMDVNGTEFTAYKSRSWEGNTAFNSGFNNNFGWGIADAKAAVEMALDPNYVSLGSTLTEVSTGFIDVNQDIPHFDVNGSSSITSAPSGGLPKIRFVSVDIDISTDMLSKLTIKLRNRTKNVESTLYWAGSGLVTSHTGGTAFRAISNAFYDLDYDSADQWELTVYDTVRVGTFDYNVAQNVFFTQSNVFDENGLFNRWKLILYTTR